ncbi:sce7725 family protein [Companilactobacillus kimchii]|uniref:Sce7725 family protein n=1 Tax=Companilactobacillus kimchii TaxID=2801452 RepID=A0A210PB88_9LACO|nr:sce7725 family protein [Companilactobacillus kimchii]KAE9557279.1 hypothetical protein ATN91_03815 [Companilactobacillus kimchii]KAE9559220.1 hypothetical protein ATN91_11245 [Companilactobacillus kimchii]OWF33734.1 hypothetical protein LKACC12383_00874 [Companilactobacillus kimchii]GEO48004.1 hypothetical protein LKI01_20030 [Companilactobacillus paralimentarius]
MYFPILRGKQNELLALRELLNDGVLSKKILPIIEPVSPSSTFRILLESFSDSNRKIAVIQNSSVADYEGFKDADISEIKSKDNFVPALVLEGSDNESLSDYSNINKMAIIGEKSDFNDSSLIDGNTYLVIEPNNRSAVRKLRNSTDFLVEMHDQFNKQDRNVDYLSKTDELFSTEHLYYKEDGYYGFSDYSVIGSDYSSAGFAAKAVAIHLVYFDENNELRVHHFVSDSNDNIQNPALKAHEALEKLVKFVSNPSFDKTKNDSEALREFEELYKIDKYSGLGYIKKLSIKHHFEIMGRYLDKD